MALTDSKFGASYKVEETAFNLAVGTDMPRWSWLETPVPASQVKRVNSLGYRHNQYIEARPNENGSAGNKAGDMVQRPELEIFGRAMVGGGKVFGAAHVFDYPWGDLGDATVVDIGGGIGTYIVFTSQSR